MTSSEDSHKGINEISIKHELEVDDKKMARDISQYEWIQSAVADTNVKCGEVFLGHRRRLILICSLCEEQYEDLEAFGDHILDVHTEPRCDSECKPIDKSFVNEEPLHAIHSRMKEANVSSIQIEVVDIEDFECMNSRNFVVEEDSTSVQCDEHANDINQEEELSSELSYLDHTKELDESVDRSVIQEVQACSIVDENSFEIERPPSTDDFDTENVIERRIYSCSICGSKYSHKRSLLSHAKKRHGIITHNHNIDEKLAAKVPPVENTHEENSMPSEELAIWTKFACEICPRSYRHKRSLNTHLRNKHGHKLINVVPKEIIKNSTPKEMKCPHCDQVFTKSIHLERHRKNQHYGEAPFACPHCDRRFRSRTGRMVHIFSHTGEYPYKCPHCPKAFRVSSNLKTHINVHLKIKNFPCQYCDKKFVQITERKIHERRHTGEKPFQCDECGRRFIVSGILAAHKRRHTNQRDFKCDICEKAFFSKEALKNHMIVHSTERPFKCNICDRCFAGRKALRQHEQLHKDKRYICNVCGKAFAQAAGLYSHKKSHGENLK